MPTLSGFGSLAGVPEEKITDKKLTSLAEGKVNLKAAS